MPLSGQMPGCLTIAHRPKKWCRFICQKLAYVDSSRILTHIDPNTGAGGRRTTVSSTCRTSLVINRQSAQTICKSITTKGSHLAVSTASLCQQALFLCKFRLLKYNSTNSFRGSYASEVLERLLILEKI